MKIFAIYLRLNLTNKPEWFDEFRSKYSSTSILHITLVQPRFINETNILDVKDTVKQVLTKQKFSDQDKVLIFHKTETDDGILMSFIEENKSIMDLQKDLVHALKDFDTYTDEATKEYELNFRPHLTLADKNGFDVSEDILSFKFEGEVEDLVLAVVGEQTISESENPSNWIVYSI